MPIVLSFGDLPGKKKRDKYLGQKSEEPAAEETAADEDGESEGGEDLDALAEKCGIKDMDAFKALLKGLGACE